MPAPVSGARDRETWRPVGNDALERLFSWLDFTPRPQPSATGDLFGGGGAIRVGDLVEITIARRRVVEVVDQQRVIAADRLHFKIEDRRVFAQRGWSLFTGPKSNVRARKVRP